MAGRPRIANFTFHGVGARVRPLNPGEDRVWMTEERFLGALDALSEWSSTAVGWSVTVDDGNISDLAIVAPALAKKGMRGAFFVCAGRLGAKGFLDESAVRGLAAMGMRIGSHGMDHVPWRGLTGDAARREFADAKAKLEDVLGSGVAEAACPFGAYDRRTLAALRACGFTRVYTSDRGGASPGSWLQARTSLGPDDDAETVRSVLQEATGSSVLRHLVLLAKRCR